MNDQANLFCCTNCFTDQAIKAFIDDMGKIGACNFCGSTQHSIAPISDAIDFIDAGIARKYEDAACHLPYESAEGGYQMPTLDVDDILKDEERIYSESVPHSSTDLSGIIARGSRFFTVPLTKRHPFSSPGDYLESWEDFCRYVKHESRFTIFLRYAEYANAVPYGITDSESMNPKGERFFNLLSAFDSCLNEFIKVHDSLFSIYRGRIAAPDETFEHKDLTSPTQEKTRNGRMSPAGISYFYGAEDPDTCVAEVRPYVGAEVVIATFWNEGPLHLLDLVDLPPDESIFDQSGYDFRIEELIKPFLREFSNEIAKPVMTGFEAIDYVPTQVFSEFIKNNTWGHHIHGIRYKSALRRSGVSIVLFRGAEISLGPNRWLEFVDTARQKVTEIHYKTEDAEENQEGLQ